MYCFSVCHFFPAENEAYPAKRQSFCPLQRARNTPDEEENISPHLDIISWDYLIQQDFFICFANNLCLFKYKSMEKYQIKQ